MKKIVAVSVILLLLACVLYLKFTGDKPVDPRGSAYAGSASCAKCHSNLYNGYLHTAHFVASIPAGSNTVHGSFAKNSDIFNVSASQKIVMEKLKNGMFQTYYLNG